MRLTKYDDLRGVYVMRPDVELGEHIQRLGKYEDRDEAMEIIVEDKTMRCRSCGSILIDVLNFCEYCGQRLKWEKEF